MTAARNEEQSPEFPHFTDLPEDLQRAIGLLMDKTTLYRLATSSGDQLRLHQYEIMNRFMASHHIVQLTGTTGYTFYLTAEGWVFVCGKNSYRELGLGDDQPRKFPIRVPGLTNIKKMHTNSQRNVFLSHDGKLWEIRNGVLQLVDGLPLIANFVADASAIVILAQDGRVFVSGDNHSDRFGIPDVQLVTDFQAVPGLSNIINILMTKCSTMHIDRDGKVFVAGANSNGQLALRDQEVRQVSTPTQVPPLSQSVIAVKNTWSNGSSTFLQLVTGDVFVCGGNDVGQLGIGVVSEHCTHPTLVPQLKNITHVYLDRKSTFALTAEGQVLSWGENDKGQLGLGDTQNRSLPSLITTLPPIASIEFWNDKVLFFSKESSSFVCGEEINILPGMEQGLPNSPIPLLVPGIEKIKEGWNGHGIYTVLRYDGVVSAWGDNRNYTLGVDSTTVSVPQIVELPPVRKYISEARPDELLHYANQGAEYFHELCFNLALRKLRFSRFSMTREDIKNILPLLQTDRCRSDERTRTLFPGYQLLPKYVSSELIDAYAILLASYTSLNGTLRAELDQQHNFIKMLQHIVAPEEKVEELREEREERRSRYERDDDEPSWDFEEREMRRDGQHYQRYIRDRRVPVQVTKGLGRFGAFAAQLQSIPTLILKPVAEILLAHLPMPALPEIKRKPEDELEDDERKSQFKKLKS